VQVLEKVDCGAIGGESGRNRIAMGLVGGTHSLDRAIHRVTRGPQGTECFIVRVQEGTHVSIGV
jgi:hypothetical protein